MSVTQNEGKTTRMGASWDSDRYVEQSVSQLRKWFATLPLRKQLLWIALAAACFQTAFQTPYVIITTRDSANVCTALVCGTLLVLSLLLLTRDGVAIKKPEILISGALTVLAALSAWSSDARFTASVRSFVVVTSALAGYWTARLLIDSEPGRRVLQWLFLALLIPTLFLVMAGLVQSGKIYQFLDSHWHPVGARVLLFSFAPLAMLGSSSKRVRIAAVGVLCASYGGLLLAGRYAGMESVVLIPVVLCLVAIVLSGHRRLRTAVLLFLIVSVVATVLILYKNAAHVARGHQSVAYRVENLFFSWHIASEHPWLGIGPLAPRLPYLEDYRVRYPYVTKETFTQWTEALKTSENMPLTSLVDFGLPFFVLYWGSVLYLVWQLLRLSLGPPGRIWPHPLALLLPILGALLHFNVTEGLYQPHLSWYFHMLLGLVLGVKNVAEGTRLEARKSFE